MPPTAVATKVKDPEYSNFLKVQLALYYLSDGLHSFIKNEVDAMHQSLLQKLYGGSAVRAPQCSSCRSKDVKQNRNTYVWKFRSPCLSSLCDIWLAELLTLHTNPTSNKIYWDNCDVTAWPFVPWECAKLYMPRGQLPASTGPVKGDAYALLALMANCTYFHRKLSPAGLRLIYKVSQIRNILNHSPDMRLSDVDSKSFLQDIINLLEDPTHLGSLQECKLAVNEINKIDNDSIAVSFNQELETLPLMTAENAVRRDVENQEERTLDSFESLTEINTQLKEEIRTQTDTVENRVGIVENRQETMENKEYTIYKRVDIAEKSLDTIERDVESVKEQAYIALQSQEQTNTALQSLQSVMEKTQQQQVELSQAISASVAPLGERVEAVEETLTSLQESGHRTDPVIPEEILKMDTRSLDMYKEALRGGFEKVYNIRVMVVGRYGVGKSTLTKRLLGKDVNINERKITEGIDVHRECIKVSLASGEWTAQEKNLEQDYRLQCLARVLIEKQSVSRDRVDDGKEVVISPPGDGMSESNARVTDEEHVTSPSYGEITSDSSTNVVDKEQVMIDPVSGVLTSDSNTNVADDAQGDTTPDINALVADKDPMKEMIKLLLENPDNLKQDTSRTSPLSVWDFAGQSAFYTTHQTFLTRRAIYLLVSNVSGQVTGPVQDEYYFDSEGKTMCKEHELNEVWLNAIHLCAPPGESRVPPVILVGTHVDKIKQKQLPAKGIVMETQTVLSETKEFTTLTTSTPDAATTNKQTTALRFFRSAKNFFLKPVGATPDSRITGAHVLPAENQLKKQWKFELRSDKKKKQVERDTVAAPSSVGVRSEVVDTEKLQTVSSEVESVTENIVDADAQEVNPHEICERHFGKIRDYLSDKPTRFHLVDEDFAIDNTVVDSRLEDLKRKIVEVASQQSYWGEDIPTRWLLLEHALMKLKAKVQVITRSFLEDLNQAGAVPIPTGELDVFLQFQHDIGTILYFNIEVLRNTIVLDPQLMIDAMKSLITAKRFVQRSAPDVTDKWSEFEKSGILSLELISAIWTKEPSLLHNKEHILLLMEHLNIFARPRCYSEDKSEIKVENYFLTPCMLTEKAPKEVISPEPQLEMESSSVLCFIFMGNFLPSPIFHRLLASCVSHWSIAKKKSDYLIFCDCCVFDIDRFHRLTVFFMGHIIFARVSRIGTTEKTPSSKVGNDVRKFITRTLSDVTEYLGQRLQFKLSIKCPKSDGYSEDCLIHIADLQKDVEVPCRTHDSGHMIRSHDVLKFWFEEQEHSHDGAAAGPLSSPATSDTDMFMCMVYLLVEVGSQVLRQLFHHHTVTPTCTLDQYLANNRTTIDRLYNKKLLFQSQMVIMFPPSGTTNLKAYDITLLSALFINIVPQLCKKEKKLIKSLKGNRNEIYAHASSCEMNIKEYQACWKSVSSTLISLSQQCGDPKFENQILSKIQGIYLKTIPSGSYLTIFHTWCNRMEKIEDDMQDVKSRLHALELKETSPKSDH